MLALGFALICGIVLAALMNAVHMAFVSGPRESCADDSLISPESTHFEAHATTTRSSKMPTTILYFDTPGDRLWSFIVSTLAGPYLLLDIATNLLRKNEIALSVYLFAALISALWAMTSGIIVLELAVRAFY